MMLHATGISKNETSAVTYTWNYLNIQDSLFLHHPITHVFVILSVWPRSHLSPQWEPSVNTLTIHIHYNLEHGANGQQVSGRSLCAACSLALLSARFVHFCCCKAKPSFVGLPCLVCPIWPWPSFSCPSTLILRRTLWEWKPAGELFTGWDPLLSWHSWPGHRDASLLLNLANMPGGITRSISPA